MKSIKMCLKVYAIFTAVLMVPAGIFAILQGRVQDGLIALAFSIPGIIVAILVGKEKLAINRQKKAFLSHTKN